MDHFVNHDIRNALLAAVVAVITEALDLWLVWLGVKLGPIWRLVVVAVGVFCATLVGPMLVRSAALDSPGPQSALPAP